MLETLSQIWSNLVDYFRFDPADLTDPMMIGRLVLQFVLLLGSGFFSGSETALFSLSRLDLQKLRKQRHRNSETVHELLDQPRRLIISILCGNELVNIAAIVNMTTILVTLYGSQKAGVICVVLMLPLVLLFGEVTPKTIAVSNPVRFGAGLVARPLSIWVRLMTPLRWLIRSAADRITTMIVGEDPHPENILQVDEFRSLVEEVAKEGELNATERVLIHNLLDAGDTEVVEIMTPRTRTEFISDTLSVPEVLERVRTVCHSRIPVYSGHRDNLIGFVHAEDVLRIVLDKIDVRLLSVDDVVHPPVVVPPTKKVDEMFDFFQEHNCRAAAVLNEFGGVEGFVTITDVLNFIFGQISGRAVGEELHRDRDQDEYEVPGEMKLLDFNNLTHFGLEDPRMTTIAGVAFRHLDRLPHVGDTVTVDDLEITVLEVVAHRIAKVRVRRVAEAEDEELVVTEGQAVATEDQTPIEEFEPSEDLEAEEELANLSGGHSAEVPLDRAVTDEIVSPQARVPAGFSIDQGISAYLASPKSPDSCASRPIQALASSATTLISRTVLNQTGKPGIVAMYILIMILVMCVLLLLKGFFSGSEIALVNVDKLKLTHRASHGHRGSQMVLSLFRTPEVLLTTTLVGTNLTTITLSTIGTLLLLELLGGVSGDVVAFLVYTPLFLILGEIVPKSVYQQKSDAIAPLVVYPLRVFYFVFFPIVFVFSRIARLAATLAGSGPAGHGLFITREQVRSVVEMAERGANVDTFDRIRIKRAIRFAETTVGEAMIPIAEVVAVNRKRATADVIERIRKRGYNRLPVYEGNISNVVGVVTLTTWDLMDQETASRSLDELIRPALYVTQYETIDQLLPVLRARDDHMAIVVDEFGSAVGIITMEDIIEEVVGDVEVGYEFEEYIPRRRRQCRVLDPEEEVYEMDGRLPISEANDVLGLSLSTTEFHTVAGLIMARLRRLPSRGDSIVDSGYRFTVQEATDRFVTTVLVERDRSQPETAAKRNWIRGES